MPDLLPSISLPPEGEAGTTSHLCLDSPDRGSLAVFRKPATPDPFINAAMSPVGPGDDGRERYWISSVNSLCGATSFLLNEDGEYRRYDWPVDRGVRAIYSVAPESHDVLWLAGGALGHVIRLELASGEWEMYPWGGGRFATAGMAFDAETGKLFCGLQTALVSFDTAARQTARVYGPEERPPDNHHYDHWRLPDGSYGFVLETPGLSILRWDPRSETISWRRLSEDRNHPTVGHARHLKNVREGLVYLPHMGWLDGLTGDVLPHSHPPEQEASWFGVRGDWVFGVSADRASGSVNVVRWDATSGYTEDLFAAPDTTPLSFALTPSGKIVLVDVYGRFHRHDGTSGECELSRDIGVRQEHSCNVITPGGDDLVVGAPFISQSFWTFDTGAAKGLYGGRAGGSFGQVDYGAQVGGKVYFAIYGGGQLTEYDPHRAAGYPHNPRLVAQNEQGQHGAGITTDGRIIWVAYRPRYGTLDGAMIRYDPSTDAAAFRNATVPAQYILNPMHDRVSGKLVAGTCCLSDCESAVPECDTACAVVVHPETMEALVVAPAPDGVDTVTNLGPLGDGRWLMECGRALYFFDPGREVLAPWDRRSHLPEGAVAVVYAGQPGHFVLQAGDALHLWDVAADAMEPLARLGQGFVGRWWLHGADLTFDCGRYAAVWRGALSCRPLTAG